MLEGAKMKSPAEDMFLMLSVTCVSSGFVGTITK
ncbi:Uncharacterized protein BM_BM17521 [Brugia malayi]|uniref:Uncharacterized protein n=1 Tax=Brugia malayi TaxID=6279 RepID=A0A4E9FDG8_BRUMA|nr:Uncharacterized protein BM_BM17521 [Brugia malayi]VIO94269.1 Uncharacterized protein BM_BM17521 [Brugia malayi]